MKNKMADLRNHLFETIEALKDPDKPMEIARAKAISDVAQTIINSAKVEVDLVKALDVRPGTHFFEIGDAAHFDTAPVRTPKKLNGGAYGA